jgi:uncharacterized protein (TIGR02453 family)
MSNNESGFPKSAVDFLTKLKRNNNRDWFESHREEFQYSVLEPAREFVIVLGEMLRTIAPDIIAIPKVDKSIFRLHRDVRFSKDKSPYKTNLGLFFWEGTKKKMECSGFYFHLEPGQFFIGNGIYIFTDELMKEYRDVISTPNKAKELDSIIKKLKKKGYGIGGKYFKQTPRGLDKEYPYAEYFLYNGLYAYGDSYPLKDLYKQDVVKYSFKKFKEMLPIHRWLVKNLG